MARWADRINALADEITGVAVPCDVASTAGLGVYEGGGGYAAAVYAGVADPLAADDKEL